MPKQKIDRVKLNQMLRANKPQNEIAKHFGVSEGAISKAKRELNINVVKDVALEDAHNVVSKNLDAVGQLQKINEKANQILDELTGTDKVIDRMTKAVEGSLSYKDDPVKQRAYIERVIREVNQDKETALKAMREIRGQLNLQLEIFRTLYDMESVAAFQRAVLEGIQEVEPEVRNRIVEKLKADRAFRQSVKLVT